MNKHNRVLVLGSGGIAKRHLRNLHKLNHKLELHVCHPTGRAAFPNEYESYVSVITYEDIKYEDYLYAIIATPATLHLDHALFFVKANVPVLIEKPLSVGGSLKITEMSAYGELISVAYNLRYLSSLNWVRKNLCNGIMGRIVSVVVEVGQYLPDWRPDIDYRTSVSAQKALGGGVLAELSHELDYLYWIFGGFKGAYCNARNSNSLDIDVEDVADIFLEHNDGWVANVHLDMLQNRVSRKCKIITDNGDYLIDLLENSVRHIGRNGEALLFSEENYSSNTMYEDMLSSFQLKIDGAKENLATFKESAKIVQLIDKLKESSIQKKWVSLDCLGYE